MTEPVLLPGSVVEWMIMNDSHHLRISDTPAYGRLYILEDENEDEIASGATMVGVLAGLKAHKQNIRTGE